MFAALSLAPVRSAFCKIAPLKLTWLRSVVLKEAPERLQPLQSVSPALIRATEVNEVTTGPEGWACPMISATAEDASAPRAKRPARARRAKRLRIRKLRTGRRHSRLQEQEPCQPVGARCVQVDAAPFVSPGIIPGSPLPP